MGYVLFGITSLEWHGAASYVSSPIFSYFFTFWQHRITCVLDTRLWNFTSALFSDVCCFYLALFSFLTYLLSFYLPCKAQHRRFLLSEAYFPFLGTKLTSLSYIKPLYICLDHYISSLNYNYLFTYFFSSSLNYQFHEIGILFLFISSSLDTGPGT